MPGQILIVNPRGGKPRKVQIMAASKPKKKLYGAAAAAHAKKHRGGGATKRRSAKARTTSVKSLRGLFARNPRPSVRGIVGSVTAQATAAGLGAIGGAGIDLAMRPLPVKLKVGPMGILTRAALSIGVGLLGSRMKPVAQMAQGALTITLYNALRQYVTVPMNLGEISEGDMQELSALVDGSAGVPLLADDSGMGAYEAGELDGYEAGDTDSDQYVMD